jgi:hypothetical protein
MMTDENILDEPVQLWLPFEAICPCCQREACADDYYAEKQLYVCAQCASSWTPCLPPARP